MSSLNFGTEQQRKALLGGVIVVALIALYFAVNALHPLGPGVVLKGLVTGGLSSLVAMGLVLIYRSARIINFSQQVIGGLAATVSILLVASWGWSYWVAVPLGLVVAVLTGLVVDTVVIQRFTTAPRLILTVATIGVYQLLGAAELGLPNLFTLKNGVHSLTSPFTFHFYVSPRNFTGDDVVALVAVPLALIGLYLFFVKTDYGVAIRGAADSNERALLLGIPVRNLSRITWMVAAGLSGVGAILSAPDDIGGFSVGNLTSPATLLLPLAAAVLAGMESLPLTVAWALVLGVVNEAVYAIWLQASYQDVAQFLVIMIGLLFVRRRGSDRRILDGLGEFIALREVPPVPHHLARLREVRLARTLLVTVGLVLAVVVPMAFSQSKQLLLANVAIYAMIGISIVVLTGWAGQISLGQFAFVGIGAATAGAMMVSLHVDFFVAMLAAAAVGALVAVLIGLPALRIPGLYLAVATLAFAVMVSTYLLSSRFFPWLNPTIVTPPVILHRFNLASPFQFYILTLIFLLATMVAARNLRRARTGRVVIAVRDNARGASAYSVSPLRTKLMAFVISGAIAGIAGSLYEVGIGGISSGGLPPDLSITVFVMVVIGGMGSITGAVIGAIYVQGVAYFLPQQSLALLATGAGLLILLMVLPEGLGSLVFRARDYLLRDLELRRASARPPAAPVGERAIEFGGRSMETELGASQAMERIATGGVNPLSHTAALRLGALEELETHGAASGPEAASPHAGPPGNRSALVAIDSVDAGYGGGDVLHDVAIGVAQSEVVALLGTNGAGKTTMLRTIAGLIKPSKGSVSFIGHNLESLSPAERVRAGVVTVLGGRGIFPSLTVSENLRLATWTVRKFQKDQAFVDAATRRVLDMFPVLAERGDQRAGLLSGGEQQMLALAQALLCRPKVLLIDELSLGLAPSVVEELLKVIKALSASGVTVVIVEQSVNTATAISSRAVFIERGRVRFSGPTPDLSQQPKLLQSVFMSAAKRARKKRSGVLVGAGGAAGTGAEVGAGAAGGAGVEPLSPTVVAAPPVAGRTDYIEFPRTDDASLPTEAFDAGPPPAYAVIGVSKQFGGVEALVDVNLSVTQGEILGVIGSNGAGKTTLFDVCSGFATPDRGFVTMDGRDVTKLSAAARAERGLGRVFQDARLFPSLSVEDALAVALERSTPVRDPVAEAFGLAAVVYSEEAVHNRVEELLIEMGLERFRDKFVFELSTGTRRVVELACAVAHRPKVLLLDEPTAGISQRESEALAELLMGLREETDASFIVIEHDVPLVSSIADRLVCMHLGEVISEGDTSEVLNDPLVVTAYLGTEDVPHRRLGGAAGSAGTQPVGPAGSMPLAPPPVSPVAPPPVSPVAPPAAAPVTAPPPAAAPPPAPAPAPAPAPTPAPPPPPPAGVGTGNGAPIDVADLLAGFLDSPGPKNAPPPPPPPSGGS